MTKTEKKILDRLETRDRTGASGDREVTAAKKLAAKGLVTIKNTSTWSTRPGSMGYVTEFHHHYSVFSVGA